MEIYLLISKLRWQSWISGHVHDLVDLNKIKAYPLSVVYEAEWASRAGREFFAFAGV